MDDEGDSLVRPIPAELRQWPSPVRPGNCSGCIFQTFANSPPKSRDDRRDVLQQAVCTLRIRSLSARQRAGFARKEAGAWSSSKLSALEHACRLAPPFGARAARGQLRCMEPSVAQHLGQVRLTAGLRAGTRVRVRSGTVALAAAARGRRRGGGSRSAHAPVFCSCPVACRSCAGGALGPARALPMVA